MEKTEVYWLIGIVGTFCGVILGMVRHYAGRMDHSIDKLIDVTNSHTTVIAVETTRNDDQDDKLDNHETRLNKHDDEIDSIKEKIWEVRYKRA